MTAAVVIPFPQWAATRHRTAAGAVPVRTAVAADTDAIFAIIEADRAEGHLLPRRRDEIAAHAHRFVVAEREGRVVACGELAPLSREVAEVRSLAVAAEARGCGLGTTLVEELADKAAASGFHQLCAFTHAPAFFIRMDFSIVPHTWLPEKVTADCDRCPRFGRCGQYAVVRELAPSRHAFVPLAALHG